MNLNPSNPRNVQPLTLKSSFGPGLMPPYQPLEQTQTTPRPVALQSTAAPGAGQPKKKPNALLIAAIIGVPIVAGMFID